LLQSMVVRRFLLPPPALPRCVLAVVGSLGYDGIMRTAVANALPRIVAALAILLLAKVLVSVIWEYRNYLPPNFRADFLLGREKYFFGAYSWAFYAHLASGPPTLALGA